MEIVPNQHKWSGWKSPVGLGIFLLTASLALAIFLYTVLNLIATVAEFAHPQSQGLSAQELQQLEQSSAPVTGTTGAAGAQ